MKQKCYYCQHFSTDKPEGVVFCNLHKREVKRGCKFFVREPGSDDDLINEEREKLYGSSTGTT
jgi:hypothetical protein